jgi:hypothetical protein
VLTNDACAVIVIYPKHPISQCLAGWSQRHKSGVIGVYYDDSTRSIGSCVTLPYGSIKEKVQISSEVGASARVFVSFLILRILVVQENLVKDLNELAMVAWDVAKEQLQRELQDRQTHTHTQRRRRRSTKPEVNINRHKYMHTRSDPRGRGHCR